VDADQLVHEVQTSARDVREGAAKLRRVAAEVDAAAKLIDRNTSLLRWPDRRRGTVAYAGPERRGRR